MNNSDVDDLLQIAEDFGFETKIFSSFGRNQNAGCGMLNSDYTDTEDNGKRFEEQYNTSLELLIYAVHSLKKQEQENG